ncbi:methylthioribose-1-phosphate isomerase [Desulfonispora thiosulfatigenes DSM 11270]|uniref:Methylthioribose-1-phosphate isomerase n=1 Tax=Desulfonispora thiosulfatigenes DSM 11270 TaxID=656914 RepID=A0A1W1VJW6_DESTI|nr:S-methyl-5-thioribose-1-phosphate isomerase [Desulfonispora thiosulfatigenes]SMB93669.1 methylthioribose-1-phosphate isomerase [Desulfonispora thiosulfatigenes DSM 11270]
MKVVKFELDKLMLLDQTKLPLVLEYVECKDYLTVCDAIRTMKVRGAPAIGVAAAYGVVLASKEYENLEINNFKENLLKACDELNQTRPTAVNLFWAIERMKKIINKHTEVSEVIQELEKEAIFIETDDLEMNRKMGRHGSALIPNNARILTHCNAGSLATAGYGTALGVIRASSQQGKVSMVYVDETRPLLQGARLTAYELMEDNIPITLICDNMAAYCMQLKLIDCIIVGADRIAANGDVANKIGTYGLAVLAKAHNIPFYVAAPVSTFDFSLESGKEIPIEERAADEIRKIGDVYIAPPTANVFNPAFDLTPNELITAIITDKGVIKPNYTQNIQKVLGNGN